MLWECFNCKNTDGRMSRPAPRQATPRQSVELAAARVRDTRAIGTFNRRSFNMLVPPLASTGIASFALLTQQQTRYPCMLGHAVRAL